VRAAGLTRAYSMDWIGATQATKHATIDGYLADVERAVATIGGPVNLVGDCQGGWLATVYAALRPDDVHTLTIAGAPIDFHAGEPVIGGYVEMFEPAFYEALVASGGGVLKGEYLLGGFIAIKPQDEVARQVQLLSHLDDAEHLERYSHFEDWFKHTQDLAGDFYLWIVEHLFRRNALIRGDLEIGGERVDLRRISCPLMLLAGASDHITPPPQVFRARDFVSSEVVVERLASGGHLGLFMGREALRDHWPPILAEVACRSGVRGAVPVVATPAGHAPEQPAP
jgi:poly(3-hydroxyalkanoate) synthetase